MPRRARPRRRPTEESGSSTSSTTRECVYKRHFTASPHLVSRSMNERWDALANARAELRGNALTSFVMRGFGHVQIYPPIQNSALVRLVTFPLAFLSLLCGMNRARCQMSHQMQHIPASHFCIAQCKQSSGFVCLLVAAQILWPEMKAVSVV